MSVHGGIRFGDERLYKPFPSQDPTLRLSFRPVPQTVDGIHRSNQQAHALFSLTCLCKCLFYVPMRTCVYKTGNAGLPHSEVTFVFRVCAALLGVGQTDAALCLKLFYFQSFLSVTGLRKLGAGGGLVHMLMCYAIHFLYSTIIQLLDHQLLPPRKVGP